MPLRRAASPPPVQFSTYTCGYVENVNVTAGSCMCDMTVRRGRSSMLYHPASSHMRMYPSQQLCLVSCMTCLYQRPTGPTFHYARATSRLPDLTRVHATRPPTFDDYGVGLLVHILSMGRADHERQEDHCSPHRQRAPFSTSSEPRLSKAVRLLHIFYGSRRKKGGLWQQIRITCEAKKDCSD